MAKNFASRKSKGASDFSETPRYLRYEIVSVESIGLEEQLDTTEETLCIAGTGDVFALEVLREDNNSVHRSVGRACNEAFGARERVIPVDTDQGSVGAETFVTCPDRCSDCRRRRGCRI